MNYFINSNDKQEEMENVKNQLDESEIVELDQFFDDYLIKVVKKYIPTRLQECIEKEQWNNNGNISQNNFINCLIIMYAINSIYEYDGVKRIKLLPSTSLRTRHVMFTKRSILALSNISFKMEKSYSMEDFLDLKKLHLENSNGIKTKKGNINTVRSISTDGVSVSICIQNKNFAEKKDYARSEGRKKNNSLKKNIVWENSSGKQKDKNTKKIGKNDQWGKHKEK